MGSDRARISYDAKQQYRSVVMQQGRVTVEADWNESQLIASEETRLEALDFVGPIGTPDGGYAITLGASGYDFAIGPGTMYVGGVRASLEQAEQYSAQADWLDSAVDPAWMPVPTAAPATNEYVYLVLREQEVSAVEDSDLKDVALGGPDTAQRTRLIQHVERLATPGADCPSALAAAQTSWAADGFTLDTTDMQVESFARLQVSFLTTGTSTPCDPVAQGGYLGADNQLIRVQIASAPSGALMLLWGFDDASFLYRVTVNDPQTVTLQAAPVDAEHNPQGGQAVEILMDAATLANGQYVAAPSGQVFTLATSSYAPDSQKLSLPAALNGVYGDGTSNNPGPAQVYLRMWEQLLPFTPGAAVTLGDTNAQITLTTTNGQPFRAGDYWMFAVRPGTAQQVYPERYQAAPQPPEGPREWICPLAVLLWTESPAAVTPCQNAFDNLVTLTGRNAGGCCEVNVTADEHNLGVYTIQMAVDALLQTGGSICLGPGTFYLQSTVYTTGAMLPILIKGEGAGSIYETTGFGVTTLVAPPPTLDAATPAILIDSFFGVTVEDLQINFAAGSAAYKGLSTVSGAGRPNPAIMIQNSSSVTVQRCFLVCSSNTLPTNAAVGLGGVLLLITIEDNVILFNSIDASGKPTTSPGIGIARLETINPVDDDRSVICLTYDLYIRRNLLECGNYGVLLDNTCYHFAQVEVSNNIVTSCMDAGIAIGGSGIVAIGHRAEINDNEVLDTSGAGIVCGISARICNNDLKLSLPAVSSYADFLLSGILITAATDPTVVNDGTQIVGNRISGAAGFGILMLAPMGSAAITNNTIASTSSGGISSSGGAAHLSITNNQLISLVPDSTNAVITYFTAAYGIVLVPGTVNGVAQAQGYAEVEGNFIQNFATDAKGSAPRIGISVQGYQSSRIAGNQLINIGPASSTVNGSVGISAGFYAFDRAEVIDNVIRRSDAGITAETTSSWQGIYITGPDTLFANLGQKTVFTPHLLNQQLIKTNDNQFVGIGPVSVGYYNFGGLEWVSVRGNFVDVAGSAPAVNINVNGNCAFTDNQCRLATGDNPVAAVVLNAALVAVANNIVQGGAGLSIEASDANSFTAIGNLVPGSINANGAALTAPWNTLNIG